MDGKGCGSAPPSWVLGWCVSDPLVSSPGISCVHLCSARPCCLNEEGRYKAYKVLLRILIHYTK